jgi:hypothetical protein
MEGKGEAKDDGSKQRKAEVKGEETETRKAVKKELSEGVADRKKSMASKMGKRKGAGKDEDGGTTKRFASKPIYKERD